MSNHQHFPPPDPRRTGYHRMDVDAPFPVSEPTGPAQPPKRKQHRVLKVLAVIFGGLLLLGVIVAIVSPTPQPAADQAPLPNTVPTVTATVSVPAPVETTQAPPQPAETTAPPAPAAKKWVKLVTLKGTKDDSTDTFTTTGGKIRIRYSFKDTSGYDLVGGAVYLLPDGTDLKVDGGIPDVMIMGKGETSVTNLRKDAGAYYLQVNAANSRYTVTVEEQR